jgi:hypothetical protein
MSIIAVAIIAKVSAGWRCKVHQVSDRGLALSTSRGPHCDLKQHQSQYTIHTWIVKLNLLAQQLHHHPV